MTPEQFDKAAEVWTSKEADASRMPKDELHREIDNFLSSHNTCALACGAGDFVRCTPLEYAYRDGAIWIFSEGGLKFRALKDNLNVCLAVFDPYDGFGTLQSAQVTGTAEIVDPDSSDFAEAAAAKGLKAEMLPKIKQMLNLIKITPTRIDYLSSSLKSKGYDSRQWIEF